MCVYVYAYEYRIGIKSTLLSIDDIESIGTGECD